MRAECDWLEWIGGSNMQGVRIAPNWFTAAMGTGILANAAALLPLEAPLLRVFAIAAWLVAVLLLARLAALSGEQWRRDRRDGRAAKPHALATAPFWGAPPMAVLTLSSGTLLVGRELLGEQLALAVALTLWVLGTLGGVAAAVAVPRWLLRHPQRTLDAVFATWLLPVVPPLVAATSGAALAAHVPAGPARLTLLLACCALFAVSLLTIAAMALLVGRRLVAHGPGPARMVPTLFIALGPLGQSVTAACLLAAAAPGALPAPLADGSATLALLFGLPVFALAMGWLALAAAATVRTAAGPGLPFAATWWSFIFPLGTCVTGSSELALRTGAAPLAWVAVGLFSLLLAAWLTVASATARHAVIRRGARRAQARLAPA